jgi:hypothetical protein
MLANLIMNRGYLIKIRCNRSSSPFSSSSFSSLRSSSPLSLSRSSSSSVSVRPTVEIHYHYQSYCHFCTSVSKRSSEAKAIKSSSKLKEVLVYTGTTIDEYNNDNNNDNNNYSLVIYPIISTCVMIILHYIFIYVFRIIFKEDEMVA